MDPSPESNHMAERAFYRLFGAFVLLSSGPWALNEQYSTVFRAINVGLALLLILRPSHRDLRWLVPASFACDFITRLPLVPNHDFLAFALCLGILICTFSKGISARGVEEILTPLRPFLVALAAVIYFYGFYHKLNFDFFNPELTCAVRIIDETLLYLIPGNPENMAGPLATLLSPLQKILLAWFVVLAEALLFVLIIIQRTRRVGLFLALGFHSLLAPMVETFALLMSVVLIGIHGPSALSALETKFTRWFDGEAGVKKRFTTPTLLLVIWVVAYLALGALTSADVQRQWKSSLTMIWLLPLMGWLMGICLRVVPSPMGPLKPWAYPLVAILLLNGASPYLGWKTVTAYSMFSNLRTEDRQNHLLIKKDWDLLGDQSKLWSVGIKDQTGTPVFIANDLQWPEFEIRRWIHHGELIQEKNPLGWSSFVEVDGKTYDLKGEDIKSVAPFNQPLPWWERKLRLFRPLKSEAECSW